MKIKETLVSIVIQGLYYPLVKILFPANFCFYKLLTWHKNGKSFQSKKNNVFASNDVCNTASVTNTTDESGSPFLQSIVHTPASDTNTFSSLFFVEK